MGATQTTFTPVQKDIFTGTIYEQLNSDAQLFGWFSKRGADGGIVPQAGSSTAPQNTRHMTLHTGRNAGGGFLDPDATFPQAGAQGYKRLTWYGRTLHWPVNVPRSLIRNTRTDAAAYARAMIEEAKRVGDDFQNEMERIIQGDGSGFLGEVSAVSDPNNTVTLKNPADARKFYVGMWLSAWSTRAAGATQRIWDTGDSYAQVTAVDPTGGIITVDAIGAAVTVAAGDILAKAYDQGSSNFIAARTSTIRYEPVGVDAIVSDRDSPMESSSTYGGLFGVLAPNDFTGTTNGANGVTAYAAYVNRNGGVGRSYTDDILQSLRDNCEIRSGKLPSIITTSYGGRNEFAKKQMAIRRSVNTNRVAGETGAGYSEDTRSRRFLEFEDTPIVPSRYAPVSLDSASQKTCSFTAINLDYLWVEEWHKPRFMDDDGLTWRMVSRTPYFESILEYQCELVANCRNCHAKAVDVLASDYL